MLVTTRDMTCAYTMTIILYIYIYSRWRWLEDYYYIICHICVYTIYHVDLYAYQNIYVVYNMYTMCHGSRNSGSSGGKRYYRPLLHNVQMGHKPSRLLIVFLVFILSFPYRGGRRLNYHNK